MSVQFGAVLPVNNGIVTTYSEPSETFLLTDILNDPETQRLFIGNIGGTDIGFPWPSMDFGYVFYISTCTDEDGDITHVGVTIITDIPVEDYCLVFENDDY